MIVNFAAISRNCAKTLLLVLNGCCILLALCTLIFAVVDTRIVKTYCEERASGTYIGDVIIILACLLLIAVAAFGSAGAIRENVKILYFYIAFLMMMVVLQMLIAVYVALQRYGLQFRVTEWLREDFFKNTTDDDLLHNKLWDDLQVTYECCGLNGPEDYIAMQKHISMSCCPRAYRARTAFAKQQMYRACIDFLLNSEYRMHISKTPEGILVKEIYNVSSSYYTEGCEDEVLYALKSDADWLLGVAVTSFWFEAAGMLLAMWVANNVRSEVQIYKQTIRY